MILRTLNPPSPPHPPSTSTPPSSRRARSVGVCYRSSTLRDYVPASTASGQSPRTPRQRVPPVIGGTSSCDARPRRSASRLRGAIQERRRGDACRSTVMQTASNESKQNGACPMLHSFCACQCRPNTSHTVCILLLDDCSTRRQRGTKQHARPRVPKLLSPTLDVLPPGTFGSCSPSAIP